eukprot:g3373.t1
MFDAIVEPYSEFEQDVTQEVEDDPFKDIKTGDEKFEFGRGLLMQYRFKDMRASKLNFYLLIYITFGVVV